EVGGGVPVAGPDRDDLAGLIGLFVNTLPLRTDLSGDPTFGELLERVRDTSVSALAHQDVPFDRLVEELEVPRRPGLTPLFQAAFALQSPWRQTLRLDGMECETVDVDTGGAPFDLTLEVEESEGALEAVCSYARDMFDEATVARFSRHLLVLLDGIATDSGRPISGLDLLPREERGRLRAWSGRVTPFSAGRAIDELFEEWVAR